MDNTKYSLLPILIILPGVTLYILDFISTEGYSALYPNMIKLSFTNSLAALDMDPM